MRAIMSAAKLGVSKRKWALLYEAVVSETDDRRRLHLIALAKGAIFERQQALAHARTDALEERQALEDAAYVLAAMRKAAEFNLQKGRLRAEDFKTGTE
jgi:hypothetical protein